jgi:hypothetical protein
MESQGCEMLNVRACVAVYLHVHVSRIMHDAVRYHFPSQKQIR